MAARGVHCRQTQARTHSPDRQIVWCLTLHPTLPPHATATFAARCHGTLVVWVDRMGADENCASCFFLVHDAFRHPRRCCGPRCAGGFVRERDRCLGAAGSQYLQVVSVSLISNCCRIMVNKNLCVQKLHMHQARPSNRLCYSFRGPSCIHNLPGSKSFRGTQGETKWWRLV